MDVGEERALPHQLPSRPACVIVRDGQTLERGAERLIWLSGGMSGRGIDVDGWTEIGWKGAEGIIRAIKLVDEHAWALSIPLSMEEFDKERDSVTEEVF
jgi:hypothetical protein